MTPSIPVFADGDVSAIATIAVRMESTRLSTPPWRLLISAWCLRGSLFGLSAYGGGKAVPDLDFTREISELLIAPLLVTS